MITIKGNNSVDDDNYGYTIYNNDDSIRYLVDKAAADNAINDDDDEDNDDDNDDNKIDNYLNEDKTKML